MSELTRAEIEEYLRVKSSVNLQLVGRDLSGVDLSNLSFRGAILEHVTLRGANLENSDLRDVNLYKADLSNANIKNADFSHANLKDADLTNTNANQAVFKEAKYTKKTIWPIGFAPSRAGAKRSDDDCFIATAATGRRSSWQVYQLRRFRNIVLEQSDLGRAFIDWYYSWSPQMAAKIGATTQARHIAYAGITILAVISIPITQVTQRMRTKKN